MTTRKKSRAGRKPKSPADRRDQVVQVLLTPAELAASVSAANAAGVKTPDWWREAAALAIARGSTR